VKTSKAARAANLQNDIIVIVTLVAFPQIPSQAALA
jgi:hypothetical protein